MLAERPTIKKLKSGTEVERKTSKSKHAAAMHDSARFSINSDLKSSNDQKLPTHQSEEDFEVIIEHDEFCEA